jgi:hypothetical protein
MGAPPGYGPPMGAPMGAPPGYGPPMGGPMMPVDPQLKSKVDLWFILSIVSLFVGCGLFGIINIVYANGAKEALARGDAVTADSKIGVAKTLCIVGYVFIGLYLLFIIGAAIFVGGF